MFVTRWRVSLLRCSPRLSFFAILMFVTLAFLLTTYMYSGSAMDMRERQQARLQGLENDLRLRHIHEDWFVDQWSRHKNQHKRKEEDKLNTWDQPSTPRMKQVLDVISLMSKQRSSNDNTTLSIQKELFGDGTGNVRYTGETETEDAGQLLVDKYRVPLNNFRGKQLIGPVSGYCSIKLFLKWDRLTPLDSEICEITQFKQAFGWAKQVLRRQIKFLREAMTSKHTMLPKPASLPACVGNIQPDEVEDILCIPRPKYLTHIKNPCWYSENPSNPEEKMLHCLPYFHILGCAKSGTTDLWNRLMSHPHTISNDGLLHKEALWWSWHRYGMSGYSRNRPIWNFSDYVNLFQDTARQIQSSIEQETLFHQILITGDASPPDFWDFKGWTNISQNRHHTVPSVITPHLMRHIYADPKFIIMFRDPIERLYSDYFFVGLGLTSEDFHNDILASVEMLATCVEQRGLHRCFHDYELYIKLPVRLPFACYSVFMREWLQVFPLDNFLFIKTEEYESNLEETLKSVMEFLGLGPLKDTQLQVIAEEERSRVTLQRKIAGPMMNSTRGLLEELLGACDIELARLLKSDKFTWGR